VAAYISETFKCPLCNNRLLYTDLDERRHITMSYFFMAFYMDNYTFIS